MRVGVCRGVAWRGVKPGLSLTVHDRLVGRFGTDACCVEEKVSLKPRHLRETKRQHPRGNENQATLNTTHREVGVLVPDRFLQVNFRHFLFFSVFRFLVDAR